MKVKNVDQMIIEMEKYEIDFTYNLFGVNIVHDKDRTLLGYYAKRRRSFTWHCSETKENKPMRDFVEENINGILNGWPDEH